MKILQIHKYFNKRRGGGSVTVFFEMIKMLSLKGHSVMVFSMHDKNNEKTSFSKYFTKHFDLNSKINLFEKIMIAGKFLYNFEARRNLEKLIFDKRPKIAHLHNIYHYLSPSIIDALKKHNIPIVMTLHAYKEICPNYKLFVKGKVCEKCRGKRYYNCLINRCLKNSIPGSFLAMLEAYLHKYLRTYKKIDLFIAPSVFIKNKYVEFGVPNEKIMVVRNPLDIESIKKDIDYTLEEKNYFLYYGRLSEEKGLDNLFIAIEKLERDGALDNNELYIVGKGPEEKKLRKLAEKLSIKHKIKFFNFKSGKELLDIIRQSKFIIVPSVWYENSPMVVIESQIAKKPVLVSHLGGTKELIIENETGLVFEAGNVTDLANKIKKMLGFEKTDRILMGEKGYLNTLKNNDSEKIYQEIMRAYESVLP